MLQYYNEVYDEMLNDCHEDSDICGHQYSPSRALLAVDPVAYRCGFNDYMDSLEESGTEFQCSDCTKPFTLSEELDIDEDNVILCLACEAHYKQQYGKR